MTNSLPNVPYPSNEPIKSYAPGSVEKRKFYLHIKTFTILQ